MERRHFLCTGDRKEADIEHDAVLDSSTGVEGGEQFSMVVGGSTPCIMDGGSVVSTAGTRARFRGCEILTDDDLRFLPEFEAASPSPVFCSAREAI